MTLLFSIIIWFLNQPPLYEGRDTCTKIAILKEIQTFRLEQTIKRRIPLNFESYNGMINSFKENKDTFEEIVDNYTKIDTYKNEEPDKLFRMNENVNLIKITSTIKKIDFDCRAKGARMATIRHASDKDELITAMKQAELEQIPLMLFNFHGVMSTMDGDHVVTPPANQNLANVDFGWLRLNKDGSFTYPTTTKDERDTAITGFCSKTANFWDKGPISQNTFMKLMGRLVKQFPTFNKNIEAVSKIFKNQGRNDSSSLTLMPPSPLMKLNSMVRQFKTLRNWHETTSNNFPTFTELYSLFKKSKDYFSGMLQNKFKVEPEILLERLEIDPAIYEGDDDITVLSNPYDVATIETTISDKLDLFTLYQVEPHVHRGTVPKINYLITGVQSNHEFLEMPSLTSCESGADNILLCTGWTGLEEPLGCTNYILSIAPQGSCPMENSPITTLATRTNCGHIDDVVISSSRKQVPLKIYCDGKLKSQFVMVSPVQTISTQCEIREIVGDKEVTISPQLGKDLLDTSIEVRQTDVSEYTTEFDWFTALIYIIPTGLGTILSIFFMICGTVFCLKPEKLHQLCNCVNRSNGTHQAVPTSQPGSRQQSRRNSGNNTPLNSRPTSRGPSPARSQSNRVNLSHSYRLTNQAEN